jgi:hypothetical protein
MSEIDSPFDSYTDLPAAAYPFDVYAYPEDQPDDVDPAWFIHVAEPGVLQIPGICETGFPVRIVVTFADGSEQRS